MYEASNFTEAALAFSHKYGGLGVDSRLPIAGLDDKTSLSSWREEAERAWVILKLFEAALNHDGEEVRRLHAEYNVEGLGVVELELLNYTSHPIGNLEIARIGLTSATTMVEETVQLHCQPGLRIEYGEDPFEVRAMWKCHNLLGAIYLQMYWLMTSGEDLSRCEYCGRTISFARAHPEGRKRRRDKRFCDDACRQAHHRSKKKG